MPKVRDIGRWIFGGLFAIAGVLHFVAPDKYMKIMPPYLPWHRELVLVSGGCEILLGILLMFPATRRLAAWGLIALLIAVFPANIYLYQHQEIVPGPPMAHLLRLPLQAVMIAWAYVYTRPDRAKPIAGD